MKTKYFYNAFNILYDLVKESLGIFQKEELYRQLFQAIYVMSGDALYDNDSIRKITSGNQTIHLRAVKKLHTPEGFEKFRRDIERVCLTNINSPVDVANKLLEQCEQVSEETGRTIKSSFNDDTPYQISRAVAAVLIFLNHADYASSKGKHTVLNIDFMRLGEEQPLYGNTCRCENRRVCCWCGNPCFWQIIFHSLFLMRTGSRMLGYDKGENGEWVINPKQAEIVRYIFERYVCGVSATAIAKELNAMGKKTVRGSIWRADAVLFILRNEKYVGDCESQKTVTKNFLTHEVSINEGDAPKYYVTDHHVAIIDRHTWNQAQMMLLGGEEARDKKEKKRRANNASPFTNLTYGVDGCNEPMFRIGYNTPLYTYTDERSAKAEP